MAPPAARRRVRPLRIAGLVAVLAFLVWHLLPHAVWHGSLRGELAAEPEAPRLRVETWRDLPEVSAGSGWRNLRVGELELVAPLSEDPPVGCAAGLGHCFLAVQSGTLNVFAEAPLEPYTDMLNLRAPDERDLSLWRSPLANFATIRALQVRVQTSRSNLDSWRFQTPRAKGVVASSWRGGNERFVVAAYTPDGRQGRDLGASGISRETLRRVLGSLRFSAPR